MSSKASNGHFEDRARGYFEFLAKMGLTKHLGSMAATRELIELCHIEGGQHVLEVGCGVGATVPYLVKRVGCRVTAVDLLERMAQQAQARARAQGVEARSAFAAADARRLPFADSVFDAVIMESVNVFFEDKQEAMREYVRVTRPGGYVGITEMTWLSPPSPEAKAYYKRVVYADTLQAAGWIEQLEDAGLEDVVGNAYPVDLPRESRGRIERYGCRGMLRIMWNAMRVLFRDPASRDLLKEARGNLPPDMLRLTGYGVYAGRKEG
jgi:ubiquinone/menaquinone biosynthesis C-methylase UbiE